MDRVETPWGKAVDPGELADHIASRRGHYDAVTITQNETSTGVTNDVAALAKVLSRCSYLCDGIAVRDLGLTLRDAQTVDVLPPFAGG